jgi:hypothetical protein
LAWFGGMYLPDCLGWGRDSAGAWNTSRTTIVVIVNQQPTIVEFDCAQCSARPAACDRCFPDSKCGAVASDSLSLDIQTVSITGQPVFAMMAANAVPYNKPLNATVTLVTYGVNDTNVYRNIERFVNRRGAKEAKDALTSGIISPDNTTGKAAVTIQTVDGLSITNALFFFSVPPDDTPTPSFCTSGLRSAVLFNVRTTVGKVAVIDSDSQPLTDLRFDVAPGSLVPFNVSVTGRNGAPLQGYTPTVVVLRTPPSVCVGHTPSARVSREMPLGSLA